MKRSNKKTKSGLWPAALLALLIAGSIFLVSQPRAEAAGNDGRLVFTIDQALDTRGAHLTSEEQQFAYRLEGIEEGNPLPAGSAGNSYSFTMTGTQSMTLDELEFTSPGEYRYKLYLEEVKEEPEYQCDEAVYDITVYVYQRSGGELLAAAVAVNQAGEKCDSLTFHHHYIPFHAEGIHLKVEQILETNGSILSAEDQEFVYVLQGGEAGNPLPHGAAGGSYLFTIRGNQELMLDSPQFTKSGTYHYQLYLKEKKQDPSYQCDGEVYEITVRIELSDSGFVSLAAGSDLDWETRVTIRNRAGETKESMSFHHVYTQSGWGNGNEDGGKTGQNVQPVSNSGKAVTVKTGDTTTPFRWFLLALAALIAAGSLYGYSRKTKR